MNVLNAKKKILEKNKVVGFILPDFNTCYKSVVLKKVWYWHKGRLYSDQQNRIGSPELTPNRLKT